MTYFSTCTGCGVARSDCQTLIAVKKAIAGLRITTVRHRCAQREPMYRPGDAVWIKTVAWQGGDEEPPLCEFPGVFIEQKQRKAIAFIKPGSLDGSGDEVFSTDGRGYVKVPLSRIHPRSGVPPTSVAECHCGDRPGVTGECSGNERHAAHTCLLRNPAAVAQ